MSLFWKVEQVLIMQKLAEADILGETVKGVQVSVKQNYRSG